MLYGGPAARPLRSAVAIAWGCVRAAGAVGLAVVLGGASLVWASFLQPAVGPAALPVTAAVVLAGAPVLRCVEECLIDIVAAAMRICTWNVDGLNGRVEQVVQWLHDNQPDIVGLQEAGTRDPKSVVSAFQSAGYRCQLHMIPDDKSPKQGVAILSRRPLEVTQVGLPGQEHRGARLLTASTAGLSFTTVCVPIKGQHRIERKLAWLDSLSEHLRERKTDDGAAVLCGDFNINPKPIDNYHHWENTEEVRNSPGFSEDERSRISSLLEAGWFDLVRDLNPDERIFSWWSPGKDFYKHDKGLRIDLVFGNAVVVRRLQCAWIDRGRGGKSDHAPVVVDLA